MPTFKVTLKTVNGVTCLDVDDANNTNHIPQSAQAQMLTWQLEGNAAAGSFCAVDGTPPGFAWVTNPPPSSTIFSSPSRSPNGNTLTISDLNNSSSTQGTWKYKVCAIVGGTTYCTQATSLAATTNDPTIRNN